MLMKHKLDLIVNTKEDNNTDYLVEKKLEGFEELLSGIGQYLKKEHLKLKDIRIKNTDFQAESLF